MAVITVFFVDDSGDTREPSWDGQGTSAEISTIIITSFTQL